MEHCLGNTGSTVRESPSQSSNGIRPVRRDHAPPRWRPTPADAASGYTPPRAHNGQQNAHVRFQREEFGFDRWNGVRDLTNSVSFGTGYIVHSGIAEGELDHPLRRAQRRPITGGLRSRSAGWRCEDSMGQIRYTAARALAAISDKTLVPAL